MRTSYSTHVKTIPTTNIVHKTIVDNKGKHVRIVNDKSGSLWFNRFMTGLKIRMGSTWKPNKAMSHNLTMKLFGKIESRIKETEDKNELNNWIAFAAYATISYVLSLRGNEGILLELKGLRRHWKSEETNYFIIVLFGKLKGEDGVREHLIPCINVTKSGINVKYTVSRLIELKEKGRFEEWSSHL